MKSIIFKSKIDLKLLTLAVISIHNSDNATVKDSHYKNKKS